MRYDEQQAVEQRIYNRHAAEAFLKLTVMPEWKYITNYLEARANQLMQSILAPASGGDGMTIAMSAERSKGALQEINSLPQYIGSIIKNNAQEERKPGAEVPDGQVPGVDRQGPKNEADAAAGVPPIQPGA